MAKEPAQVFLRIQTDQFCTADFLRSLANAIEENDEEELTTFETSIGCAEIDYPE